MSFQHLLQEHDVFALLSLLTKANSNRMLDEADAKAQTAPHILLASKDEPADKVALYKEVMGDKAEVTTYENMHHGWMGARSDLKNEENVKEYERGYKQAADFFAKHL